jgi:hypothetical protein
MKIKQVVKTEEVTEREISLPFYYRGKDASGEYFVKLVTENQALYFYPLDTTDPKIGRICAIRTDSALSNYPMLEPITKENFEVLFFNVLVDIKRLATPEYVLDEEDKQDFQHQY